MSRIRSIGRAILLRAPDPVRRFVMAAVGRPLPPRQPRSAAPARPAPPPAPESTGFKVAYVLGRPDLVERLPLGCRRVLDLGCATGEVGLEIRARIPDAEITGVEVDPAMAAVAAGRIDRVVTANLDDVDAIVAELADRRFDAIVAGDILEHLVDPWTVLRGLAPVLADDAWIVASLPNIGHWDTWWNVLVRRRWPYRTRGIHDSTHLRFFARRNVGPLFEQAGFRVAEIVAKPRLVERPHRWNRWSRWFALPGLRDLLTFQFIVVARRDATLDPSAAATAGVDRELLAAPTAGGGGSEV